MRIHIVQKGDTLWEIAKQYNVDFEQLKKANPQLSSPDMIMPGMKIRIPSTSKPVKKESVKPKETQQPAQQPIQIKETQQPAQQPVKKKETQMPSKPPVQKPYKDTSPKPQPVMKEDDKVKPANIQPKMPMGNISKQALFEQEMNQYTFNFPQAPKQHVQPVHHKPKPMQPTCPHCHKPCGPPMHPGHHHGMHPAYQPGMYQGYPMGPQKKGCGCGGPKPMMHHPPNHVGGAGYMNYDESPSMEMPKKPMTSPQVGGYKHYNPNHGCHPNMQQPFQPNFRHPSSQPMPYPAPPGYEPFNSINFNNNKDESGGD